MNLFREVIHAYREISDVDMGYDPTFLRKISNNQYPSLGRIQLTDKYNKKYLCLCTSSLFEKKALASRGTRVYLARKENEDHLKGSESADVIIKDFWQPVGIKYGEAELLTQARDRRVRGIAELVTAETMKIKGQEDRTFTPKGVTTPPGYFDRIHMRLVTRSVGVRMRDCIRGDDGPLYWLKSYETR